MGKSDSYTDVRSGHWSDKVWLHEWTGNESIISKWPGFDPKGKSALEIGFGSGHFLEECAKAGAAKLFGVEVSPGAVAAAKERLAPYADRTKLYLVPDDNLSAMPQVDIAYEYTVFQHLALETVATYLALISKKLAANGQAFFQFYENPDAGPYMDEALVRATVEKAGLVIEHLEVRQFDGNQFYVIAKRY